MTEKSNKRIYVVSEVIPAAEGGMTKRQCLVNAGSQAQAIAHVVKGRFSAESASPNDVVRLMTAGATVEETGSGDE